MKTPPFELLEVLVATAESTNMIEAARKLGISQPAVSLKLKQLEQGSKLPVFAFEGKRKVLTRYGRGLYEMAREKVDALGRDFENVNRRFLEAKHLTLKVGCRPELFEYVSERLRFDGKIEYIPLSNHDAALALTTNAVDLALSYERPDSSELIATKVLESGATLVVHEKHLKGKKQVFSPVFLAETPCLFYEAHGHMVKEVCDAAGVDSTKLHVKFVSQDWRLMQSLVDQGWGYAVVPSYVRSRSPQVVTVPVPPSVCRRYQFYAIYRKQLKMIPVFKELLDQIIKRIS